MGARSETTLRDKKKRRKTRGAKIQAAKGAEMIMVLNGPNLGRLGLREPEIYGAVTYPELVAICEQAAAAVKTEIEVRQTDDEAQMISWLHEAADAGHRVVINAGGWTHTSVAVRDAASQLKQPFVEVHLSNIYAREEFRHTSLLSGLAAAVIAGLGVEGYVAAIKYLAA